MSEIVVSLSSDRDEREIDEYHDESNSSGSGSNSDSSSSSSSGENTSDEQYLSGVPLEVLQEEIRMRMASGSFAGPSTNAPSSSFSSEEETLYYFAIGIPSRTDEKKLNYLRSWYQILDDLNPCLAIRGEWCCNPRFGVGIYEAYLLRGLRLPLNAFAREILHRLGIGINQLNLNA